MDAIYCAVPHNLHEQIYIDIIRSGKHLLGEKPFGIDHQANKAIIKAMEENPDVLSPPCHIRLEEAKHGTKRMSLISRHIQRLQAEFLNSGFRT